MRCIGVQLAPTRVVEGKISSVSLLLHADNHIYTKINPGPVYALVRAPLCNDVWGVLGMEDKNYLFILFFMEEACLYVITLYISAV